MPSQGMQIVQEVQVQLIRYPPHVKYAHHSAERLSGLDIALYQPVPLTLYVFRGLCVPVARQVDEVDGIIDKKEVQGPGETGPRADLYKIVPPQDTIQER